MEKKWNEMNAVEKRGVVALFIYVAIMLVFITLEVTGKWKNSVYLYMASAYLVFEGVRAWNKKRGIALLDFVLSIIFLVNAIMFSV